MHIHPMAARWRLLSLSIVASMVALSYLFISPTSHASAAATTWKTFHDPSMASPSATQTPGFWSQSKMAATSHYSTQRQALQ